MILESVKYDSTIISKLYDLSDLRLFFACLFCRIINLKEISNNFSVFLNNNFWSMVIEDLIANYLKDPSICSLFGCLFKVGFKSSFLYRISIYIKNKSLEKNLLELILEKYDVEIGLGTKIGRSLVIDHTTGIVIGQQSVLGDNVVIMHNVTLGAIGNRFGSNKRHPEIGSGIYLGTGSTVLGNIKVMHCSNIAAGAVVTKQVLPYNNVVGIPAKLLI